MTWESAAGCSSPFQASISFKPAAGTRVVTCAGASLSRVNGAFDCVVKSGDQSVVLRSVGAQVFRSAVPSRRYDVSMYNTLTLQHEFAAAGESDVVRIKAPSVGVQVLGAASVEVFATNFPDESGSWQGMGTCTGFTPLAFTTPLMWLKAVSDAACTVSISSAIAPEPVAGPGGGSSGGLTNTELRASPVPVSASALPLPTGAAAEGTLAAASAKLPASLGAKASSASLSVVPASDAVQAGGVLASNGVRLPVDSLAQTLGYSNGLLSTITVSFGGTTYVQTLTYTSGNLTGVSQWVAQ